MNRPLTALLTALIASTLFACGDIDADDGSGVDPDLKAAPDVFFTRDKDIEVEFTFMGDAPALTVHDSARRQLDIAWDDAVDLMSADFHQLVAGREVPLRLDTIELIEVQRISYHSGAGLVVESEGEKSEEAGEPILDIGGNLHGGGINFTARAIFLYQRPDGGVEYLPLRLDEPLHYWSLEFEARASARLDTRALLTMLTGLPAAVTEALGRLLNARGTVSFITGIAQGQAFFAETEATADGHTELAWRFARDVLQPICQITAEDRGFDDIWCEPGVSRPDLLEKEVDTDPYTVMLISACSRRSQGTWWGLPIYDLFVLAPEPAAPELDLLIAGSHLNTYMPTGTRGTWQRYGGGTHAGSWGTYLGTVDDDLCGVDPGPGQRCVQVEFGRHYFDRHCDALDTGDYTAAEPSLAFSPFERDVIVQ